MMKRHSWRFVIGLVLLVLFGAALFVRFRRADRVPNQQEPIQLDPPAVAAPTDATAAQTTPTLGEAAEEVVERRLRALANELAEMRTEHPQELVRVINEAAKTRQPSPSVTLLLAIAHAETRGNILEVSEAGAVGLAQATPIAYLQEDYSGPILITNDYLLGARTYFAKKPLADADRIATVVIDTGDRKKARTLLRAARKLRREGFEDLDLLRPYAPSVFYIRLDITDRQNVRLLAELERLIDRGDRQALKEFRSGVRRDYISLRQSQRLSWQRYQAELIRQRDQLLETEFQMPAAVVKKTLPYEASEFLGRELDQRFSATRMAEFLVRHLDRKAEEARVIAGREEEIEEVTAALYNGGSLNVKRILAGLISYLPETDRYRKKVPETRKRLDRRLDDAGLTESDPDIVREAR